MNKDWYSSVPKFNGALNNYTCGGPGAMLTWIMTPAVKAALNVRRDSTFFFGDNGDGFTYDSSEPNLLPYY